MFRALGSLINGGCSCLVISIIVVIFAGVLFNVGWGGLLFAGLILLLAAVFGDTGEYGDEG